MDEIIERADRDTMLNSKITTVVLNYDKKVKLLRAFEYDKNEDKKYIRATMIMIGDEIITSNHTDTTQFIEELVLFEMGNDQNRYFSIEQHKNTKNLKLNLSGLYISKSEAKAICKIYNQAFSGYSLIRLLEFEYQFDLESLAKILYKNNFLR